MVNLHKMTLSKDESQPVSEQSKQKAETTEREKS